MTGADARILGYRLLLLVLLALTPDLTSAQSANENGGGDFLDANEGKVEQALEKLMKGMPVDNLFAQIDTNSDNHIQKDEVEAWLELRGHSTVNTDSDVTADDIIKMDDLNGDNMISFDEFSGPKEKKEL